MPPKRVFAPPYSLPGNTKGKGKAPAIDPYQHNGDTSPNDLSRDQPGKAQGHISSVTSNKH
jgi:hypothetical protein